MNIKIPANVFDNDILRTIKFIKYFTDNQIDLEKLKHVTPKQVSELVASGNSTISIRERVNFEINLIMWQRSMVSVYQESFHWFKCIFNFL